IITQLISWGLCSPKTVSLIITDQCNLYCKHCWPDSGNYDESSAVPFKSLKKIITEFADMGAEKIILTGGEPLLHPDWHEILKYTCSLTTIKKICLQTNATILTRIHVKALAEFRENITFQISLEGADAKKHDYIRGQGSFDRTIKGLNLLLEYGLGQQTCVAFTEMFHNFDDIAKVLDLAFKMGIGSFVSNTLVSGGRAARTDELRSPEPYQYIELLNLYQNDETFKIQYNQIGSIAAIEWKKGQSESGAGHCCTFIENPYVTSKGIMYPCVMLHAKEYAAKDVYNRPLNEAVAEAVPKWIKLNKIRKKRTLEIDACQKCPDLSHCACGCMGRAFAAHSSFMSAEDRCDLRRAVYNWNEQL
ncbi:radical SAM protein, partial [Desulfobacterales bacterium HSG17]|nr:radical SAM protein [Desulfobacterales bacterium HSG17]